MYQSLLDQLRPGEVRLICGTTAQGVAGRLAQSEAEDESLGRRLITCNWEELPPAGAILDQIVRSLAQSALALWPYWYGRTPSETDDNAGIGELAAIPPAVLRPWYELALACCRAGQTPQPAGFTNAVHAAQLVLAIQASSLYILLGTSASKPAPDRVLGLARASEWLADHTNASVGVIVASDLAGMSELDSINFKTVEFSWPQTEREGHVPEDGPEITIWPNCGRPHPFSPGEQLLAKRLRDDLELGPLFAFNQRVRTIKNVCHIVDLLWRDGRLVVEVDGISYHGRRDDFRKDRQRDYELLISNYIVLRIPHDEVMSNVDKAIGKIRDVVLFRQKSSTNEKEI